MAPVGALGARSRDLELFSTSAPCGRRSFTFGKPANDQAHPLVGAAALAPAGASQSSERRIVTDSKAQAQAHAKVAAKPQGRIVAAADDTSRTAEGGAMDTDLGAMTGEKRRQTRNARMPKRRKTVPGGKRE
jgi:hypothetical protein